MSSNDKLIWDYLQNETGNEYGTAAIMGNLMAESSLNPLCATGKKKTQNYVKDADSGLIDFASDGVAFGLVQWCYKTRKAALIAYAKTSGRSVGHLQMQLEYMLIELQAHYKTAWDAVVNATDIRTASDVFMLKYEKPVTTTEAAKKKRAEYGQKFYDQFAAIKPIVVATSTVRIRSGDSMGYPQVGSLKKGKSLEWVTTSRGFHAVRMTDRIGWVSGEFTEVRY